MNLRRGLFRIWLAGSLAWLGFISWQYFSRCHYGSSHPFEKSPIVLWCPVKREKGLILGGNVHEFGFYDLVAIATAFFGPPVTAFILGLVVLWIVEGFKPKSN